MSQELVIGRREIRPADLELIRQLKYLVCWADWQRVYGPDLALAETFIEQDRFRGTNGFVRKS